MAPSSPSSTLWSRRSPDSAQRPVKPRVLVVEDEDIHRQVLETALGADHTLAFVSTGAAAVQYCSEHPPDLVLMDIGLPDMDGMQVCAQLKSEAATEHIPVIFVTAHGSPESEVKGLDQGAVDFVAKPFNASVVQARVRTHLTLKRQADHLRGHMLRDGLTGVYNRQYFDERLEMEWGRANRSGLPLSLLLLDIDHFKRYNEQFGHLAGDDCLRELASACRQALRRPADLFARFGGDRFICLLPETPPMAAIEIAELTRRLVAEADFPSRVSQDVHQVTVSIGAACRLAPHATGPHALIALSDQLLRQAKTLGGDQVAFAHLQADAFFSR